MRRSTVLSLSLQLVFPASSVTLTLQAAEVHLVEQLTYDLEFQGSSPVALIFLLFQAPTPGEPVFQVPVL